MLRAARLSRKYRRAPWCYNHSLAPLNLVDDDPALAELLQPRPTPSIPFEPERLSFPIAPSRHDDQVLLYGDAAQYEAFGPFDDFEDFDESKESNLLAYQRQLTLEERTYENAIDKFKKMSASAAARGDMWSHRLASQLVGAWIDPTTLAIRKMLDANTGSSRKGGRVSMQKDAQRLMKQLSPDVLTVIVIHEAFGSIMKEPHGSKLCNLALQIGNAVRAEINSLKLRKLELQQRKMEEKNSGALSFDDILDSTGDGISTSPASSSTSTAKTPNRKKKSRNKSALNLALKSPTSIVSAVNYAAMKAQVVGSKWSTRELLLVGTTLLDILIKTAYVYDEVANKQVPAFKHYRKFIKKNCLAGMVQLEDPVLKIISLSSKNDISSFIDPKHQPMEVRPKPWTSPWDGGYLKTDVNLVRAPPSHLLKEALLYADLQTLFDGLNALGETPWRVNRGVLDTGLKLWEAGGGVAGLVSKTDVKVPTKSAFLAEEEAACREDNEAEYDESGSLRRLKRARLNAKKINREMFAQRADTQYRLDHASAFAEKERFYLPHNVDFRGRAYAIPVYLQHMGADLTRAMLTFTTPGARLGERGVYWLKIHLANLLGADKMAYHERIEVAENALSKAIQVGRDPLSDSNLEWWSVHEDPFQLLAACMEFSNAVGRYGGEMAMEDFYSTLPVSMDGSCNGLQHYAALGRDVLGGAQVNLIRSERPQDVYSGVCELVAKNIEKKAAEGDEIAKLLVGKVNRKIVKQTVMTSVYGVTLTGAREQIGNRLKDINFPQEHVFHASLMLAKMTLSSLGDIFSGATRTMDWLSNSAGSIAASGEEVKWTTPIGLPVLQPYRRKGKSIVKTIMQRVTLEQEGDHLPVSVQRQRSAFAPNFVHSIDSAHMIFTAIECKKQQLAFAAVHDSFWTNAATVDTMHKILREQFVRLHERHLLAEVCEGFRRRYPNVAFQDLPERGNLGLKEVLDSPYFFS